MKDEAILSALLACGSVRRAAAAVGCSESTIRNRLKDNDFRQRYEHARGMLLQETSGAISARLMNAADTLGAVADNVETPAAVRVSASDALLRHGLRYFEAADLERRIAELEERMKDDEEA